MLVFHIFRISENGKIANAFAVYILFWVIGT
jgi:hypothetical protein